MKLPRFLLSIMTLLLMVQMSQAQSSPADFTNPLAVPYLVNGINNLNQTEQNLFFEQFFHNFDPNGTTRDFVPIGSPDTSTTSMGINVKEYLYNVDTLVTAWGINTPMAERAPISAPDMTYLGPTLLWKKEKTIKMDVANFLPSTVEAPGHGDSTTSHWHGLNVHSQGDGGPHQPITRFNTWTAEFPLIDSAQTLWYHSHVMEFTTEQVVRGISGMIIVEDSTSQSAINLRNALPHDYAINDIPLILQDKQFDFDSTVVASDTSGGDTVATYHLKAISMKVVERPGDGEFRIVNGTVNGVLNVPNSMVRFRVLNGDSRKSFNFGFSTNIDTSDASARLTFYQVATDGGYMGQAYPMTSFLVNPGERGEFLVDFGQLANGTEVFWSNLSSDPKYAAKDIVGLGGNRKNQGPLNPGLAFVKFVVDETISVPTPITSLPDPALFPAYELQECSNARRRTKELQGGNGQDWLIDGTPMNMMVLDDTVCVNTCEKWTIQNATNVAHPFHIHKVQFQITEYIDRSGGDTVVYTFPNLPAEMMGFKDVILVRQFSDVTYQARFDEFGEDTVSPMNGYMYHCHILTHEDFSMMHQFTVVNDSLCGALGLVITGVDEPLEDKLSLYPNPVANVIYLEGETTIPGIVRITDILGKVLYEKEMAPFTGKRMIDVSMLAKGMIVVEYLAGDHRMVEKMILE